MEQLRLLLLEDLVTDAELVVRVLESAGMKFSFTIVHDRASFNRVLTEQEFDMILADNNMPQFSASEALRMLNEMEYDIPFILVTGSISEEFAVDIMKQGAWDYILKDRMQRLPNAMMSAMYKYNLKKAHKRSLDEIIINESLLKEAAGIARFGSWEIDLVHNTERWSDENYRILGFMPGEVVPSLQMFLSKVHVDDRDRVKEIFNVAMDYNDRQRFECRIGSATDDVKYILGKLVVKRDGTGVPLRINGFLIDITETKMAALQEKKVTDDLVLRNRDLEQFAYIISHNLRSPVANIVGVANVLIEGGLTPEEHVDFIQALSLSINKLDNTIIDLNHILQVRNHINEHKEYVQFVQVVDEIKQGIVGDMDEHCIMINTDFAEAEGMQTLKSYIRSVFYNLISNSIKFRQPDIAPVIEIKSCKANDKLELTFKDNGIGIDLKKRGDQIFGLYKRFHPEHAEGKGMGLYMVKTQVESLGGKIYVESEVNKGTQFKIEFELNS